MSEREPVIVVEDRGEIVSRLQGQGVPYEDTFVATIEDARRARADLRRFVRAELKRANRHDAAKLRQILLKERLYLWHCGGFERSGGRYLHCSFVNSRESGDQLRQPRFPVISDGGTDVGRCTYSLKSGQIVTIGWNSDG